MASFSCRLCGSDNLKLYYCQGNRNQFKHYKCSNCRLVNYDLSAGLDQCQYTDLSVDPSNDRLNSNRGQDQSYYFLKKHIKVRGYLIDIGCGNGRLLNNARKDGWLVKGLDLSPEWVDFVKKKLEIDVEVANFLEFEAKQIEPCDVVVLRHVLEHLPDSIKALNKIKIMLKQNGYSLLEFPNIEGFDKRLKRFLENTGLKHRKYSEDFIPGHCNEFCKESFSFLLKKTGFKLIKWETYSLKPIGNYIYNHIHIGNKARALIQKI